MQKPFPPFDTFDSNKDYDRRPVGSHDYAHFTQQPWNNSGNSQPHPQLFDSQAAPSEQFTPQPVRGGMLLQPQAVGDSPAGTEDNIDMTQHQKNDRTTPQQLFHPHGVGGSIPTALPGNTHTSTTTALPGNNTHRGMSYTTPTMTPITPATTTSKAVSGSGIQPTLQNIVATVNLACKLDLKLIVQKARNAEYNPKRFSAVIMRIREPRTTALIFSSGKMVCTGATSVELSRLAARKFARAVQKLGFPAKFLDFKVQNMVGSCDVKFSVRLETLFFKHQQFSQYEPESFPGLIYKMIEPRINLLIFVSGKVVLTGAKTREEINQAFENIYPILKSFEKIRHETNSKPVQCIEQSGDPGTLNVKKEENFIQPTCFDLYGLHQGKQVQ